MKSIQFKTKPIRSFFRKNVENVSFTENQYSTDNTIKQNIILAYEGTWKTLLTHRMSQVLIVYHLVMHFKYRSTVRGI